MTGKVAESHGKTGLDVKRVLFGQGPSGPPGSDSGEGQVAIHQQTSISGVVGFGFL